MNGFLVVAVVASFLALLFTAAAGVQLPALLTANFAAVPASLPIIALSFVYQARRGVPDGMSCDGPSRMVCQCLCKARVFDAEPAYGQESRRACSHKRWKGRALLSVKQNGD